MSVNFEGMSDSELIRFATVKPRTSKLNLSKPKQRKAIPKKRKKPRNRKTVVRLDAAGMKALREERYAMDKGTCVACGRACPSDGDIFTRMHLAHIRGRGAGGSDTIENTVSKCYDCHINKEHGPRWSQSKQ